MGKCGGTKIEPQDDQASSHQLSDDVVQAIGYTRFANSSTVIFKSWMIPRNVFRFNSPLCMGITTRDWSLAGT